jgi:hypothetical protein
MPDLLIPTQSEPTNGKLSAPSQANATALQENSFESVHFRRQRGACGLPNREFTQNSTVDVVPKRRGATEGGFTPFQPQEASEIH